MTRRVVTFDLFGWGDIATYLGVSERTVMRYAEEDGLPVYRLKGRIRARKSEVGGWLVAMTRTGRREVS